MPAIKAELGVRASAHDFDRESRSTASVSKEGIERFKQKRLRTCGGLREFSIEEQVAMKINLAPHEGVRASQVPPPECGFWPVAV